MQTILLKSDSNYLILLNEFYLSFQLGSYVVNVDVNNAKVDDWLIVIQHFFWGAEDIQLNFTIETVPLSEEKRGN